MTLTKRITASDDVLSVLRAASYSELQSGETVLKLVGQLDRKLYEAVNKVLEALHGKWARKAGGHVFAEDPRITLGLLADTGEIEIEKLDFFPTPAAICQRMIELAEITAEHDVLEPSAGDGAICRDLVATGIAPERIHAIEIDETKAAKLARIDSYHVKCCDFLDYGRQWHRIVMNPPFSGQRDIAHVEHAYECLAPGGRLVAVMAESVFFREDKKSRAFRENILAHGFDESLPAGAFHESGTGVKTRLVVVDKPSATPGTI